MSFVWGGETKDPGNAVVPTQACEFYNNFVFKLFMHHIVIHLLGANMCIQLAIIITTVIIVTLLLAGE